MYRVVSRLYIDCVFTLRDEANEQITNERETDRKHQFFDCMHFEQNEHQTKVFSVVPVLFHINEKQRKKALGLIYLVQKRHM